MAIQELAGPNSDADLIAWERELTELLLDHERLEAAWPKGATAIDRARIGRRLEHVLDDIAEIHELIADARPRTLAGAAVVLRRALAAIGDPGRLEARLVGAALGTVEASRRVMGVAT